MAAVMGIRLSCAVAGAAFSYVMAHEATKARKEKLWQWVAGKFTFCSSDPAPKPSNPCDACRKAVDEMDDAVNGGTVADIHEPTLIPEEVTENAVKGDPMAELYNVVNGERPADLAEPALIPVNMTEIAVEVDPMVEQFHPNSYNAVSVPVSGKFPSRLYADGDNTVNGGRLGRRAANPTSEVPAVDAVSLGATGVQPTVDDVDTRLADSDGEARVMDKSGQMDSDELPRDAPDPAPPPPRTRGSFLAAAGNAVKKWVRSLFSWVGTATNGIGWDPKVWDKMRRTLPRIVWVVAEYIIIEPLCRRHKGIHKIYKVVKNEFWSGCWA